MCLPPCRQIGTQSTLRLDLSQQGERQDAANPTAIHRKMRLVILPAPLPYFYLFSGRSVSFHASQWVSANRAQDRGRIGPFF